MKVRINIRNFFTKTSGGGSPAWITIQDRHGDPFTVLTSFEATARERVTGKPPHFMKEPLIETHNFPRYHPGTFMPDSTEFSQLQSQMFPNATDVIQINIKSCCLIYLTSGFRRLKNQPRDAFTFRYLRHIFVS